MFKIVILRGGLGNQMFAYAFYLALKHRFKFSIIAIEPVDCFHAHNGFELPDIFVNVEPKKSYKFYRRIQKLYSEYFTKKLFKRINEQSSDDFYPCYAKTNFPFIVFEGFWQAEKYFANIRNSILNIFQFDEKKLNDKTVAQSKILEKESSVSIHIRRSDYNEHDELGGICTLSYYQNAIKTIEQYVKVSIYYVFTDDKAWVNTNFSFFQYKLIDWNNSVDSWQDMFLMTKCKHNIIANSTFSWWGAWLNQNIDKIIIAPSKWFRTFEAKDIVPESWIKVLVP